METSCQLHGPRVLLVYGHDDFADELQQALSNDGLNVQRVHNAAEGASMAGLFKPLCIVTDLLLEEHDSGTKLAEIIKRNPLTEHMAIVMVSRSKEVTGFEFTQEKDGKWMRTDRYFERPIDTATVVAEVKAVAAEVEQGHAEAK